MTVAFARDIHPGCGPACQMRIGHFLAHDPHQHEAYGRAIAAEAWLEHGPQQIRNGPLLIDFDEQLAYLDGRPLTLAPREWHVLAFLATQVGKVQRFAVIVLAVWGPEWDVSGDHRCSGRNALNTSMTRLRTALGDHRAMLENRPNIGYRLKKVDS